MDFFATVNLLVLPYLSPRKGDPIDPEISNAITKFNVGLPEEEYKESKKCYISISISTFFASIHLKDCITFHKFGYVSHHNVGY